MYFFSRYTNCNVRNAKVCANFCYKKHILGLYTGIFCSGYTKNRNNQEHVWSYLLVEAVILLLLFCPKNERFKTKYTNDLELNINVIQKVRYWSWKTSQCWQLVKILQWHSENYFPTIYYKRRQQRDCQLNPTINPFYLFPFST